MEKIYFTYGSDNEKMPFRGGWTIIEAPTIDHEIGVFESLHPNKVNPGLLNCCSYYTEEAFARTSMSKNGNFGAFCHEHWILQKVEGKE